MAIHLAAEGSSTTSRGYQCTSSSYTNCCLNLDIGDIKCWGTGTYGLLGSGNDSSIIKTPSDPNNVINLGSDFKARQVDCSRYHCCAVSTVNDSKCWGRNNRGQLGQGHSEDIGDDPYEMGENLTSIDWGSDFTLKKIKVGQQHTCGLSDDGELKCFGDNSYGQLGQGHSDDLGDEADEVGDNLAAIDLGAGLSVEGFCGQSLATCVVLNTSDVKCFGYNAAGNLGQGTTANRGDGSTEMGDNLAVTDLGDNFIVDPDSISCGDHTTYVLSTDGELKNWGWNSKGQCGYGSTNNIGDSSSEMGNNLAVVDLGDNFIPKFIVGSGRAVFVVSINGTAKGYGQHSNGQLGYESTSNFIGDSSSEMGNALQPIRLGDGFNVTAMCGRNGGCVYDAHMDGLKCFGNGDYYALGYGDNNDRGDEDGEMGNALPFLNISWATSDPTRSPTEDPTASPTDVPTSDPTQSPTEDPTASPTDDPTRDPTQSPTEDPTASPTADPSDVPTADPTNEPTEDPTADPISDPTANPTNDPSSNPTSDPTSDPSSVPTMDPTSAPSVDPTSAPSVDPTNDPTSNPIMDPTENPTSFPSTEPTSDPTTDPTWNPTPSPSMDPTSDPIQPPTMQPTVLTANPTSTPTFCFDADYQGNVSLSAGDGLWNGQSMASSNCDCKLEHSLEGNVALFVLERGSWKWKWETATERFDYSGESKSKLEWNEDGGVLRLHEYLFPNEPTINPMILWKENITTLTVDPVLTLNADCCVELVDAADGGIRWRICDYFATPTAAPTEDVVFIVNDTSSLNAPELAAGTVSWTDDTVKMTLWITVIVLCVVVVVMVCRETRRCAKKKEDAKWRNPSTHPLPAATGTSTPIADEGRGASRDLDEEATMAAVMQWSQAKDLEMTNREAGSEDGGIEMVYSTPI